MVTFHKSSVRSTSQGLLLAWSLKTPLGHRPRHRRISPCWVVYPAEFACWGEAHAVASSWDSRQETRRLTGPRHTLFGSCPEPHHLLADVAARQHVDEGSGRLLEAFSDGLAPFEAAGTVPCHQLAERLVAARLVVADAEPL